MKSTLKIRLRELAKNLLVLSISVVLIITFLELFLHFFYPWTNVFAIPNYEADKDVGFTYKRNFSYIVHQPEFSYHFNTNSLGQRNEEVGEKKNYRILVLGDSFTVGYGVELEDTYTKRIEFLLNSLNKSVEVINAGVSAYATIHEINYLEKYGLPLQPDLIILAFMDNDIEGNNGFEQEGYPMIRGGYIIGVKNINLLTEFRMFLSKHSSIYNLIWKMAYRSALTPFLDRIGIIHMDTEGFCAKYCKNVPNRDLLFLPTISAFERLKLITNQNNIGLVVVLIPNKFQVYNEIGKKHASVYGFKVEDIDYNIPNDYLTKSLSDMGLYHVDLLPYLLNEDRMLYYNLDPHWTAEGHYFAATIITEKLINEGLVS